MNDRPLVAERLAAETQPYQASALLNRLEITTKDMVDEIGQSFNSRIYGIFYAPLA